LPWNDLLVDPKRASLALSVVQGLLNDDPRAERMALEAFNSLEDAAMSYAYLVRFLIEDIAAARRNVGVDSDRRAPNPAARLARDRSADRSGAPTTALTVELVLARRRRIHHGQRPELVVAVARRCTWSLTQRVCRVAQRVVGGSPRRLAVAQIHKQVECGTCRPACQQHTGRGNRSAHEGTSNEIHARLLPP
jgi:hypothetical protein